jgi:flagellar biosynthesis/type III secretory pathway chaperone
MDMIQQTTSLHPDLHPLLDSLINLLKREIAVYREIQAAIAHERIILMKPSLEKLLESNGKKETSIVKARMLEEGRFKIIKKIARVLDLDENQINLSTVSSYADTDQEKELKECRSILNELLASNREMNQNNKELLDYSLHFLQGTVDFIHSLLSSGSTCYMPTGRMRPISRNGKILRTEG